jgi:hypothetical protein
MKVELVTNKQLYALNCNTKFKDKLRKKISEEYQKRAFSPTAIEAFDQDFEQRIAPKTGLQLFEKILIILTAPMLPLNAILVIYLSKGNTRMQNQFWNCIIWGHMIWLIAALILGHYLH